MQPVLCRTLTNGQSTMLTAMFDGDLPLAKTPDGRAFIDRDGGQFGVILSFLRNGTCPRLPASGSDLAELLDEAQFYQVRYASTLSRGPLITSSCCSTGDCECLACDMGH